MELAKNFPKQEDYNMLEEEIKKAKSKKIIKRITSPFKRKGYQNYLENIQNIEDQYQEMNILYDIYGVENL